MTRAPSSAWSVKAVIGEAFMKGLPGGTNTKSRMAPTPPMHVQAAFRPARHWAIQRPCPNCHSPAATRSSSCVSCCWLSPSASAWPGIRVGLGRRRSAGPAGAARRARPAAASAHSIQRNYPVIGHIRWMVELVRPEIRQYLIEADEEAAPFSRSQRSLVYQRAKGEAGRAAVRHPAGRLSRRLRVHRPLDRARPRPPIRPASASPSAATQCAKPYSRLGVQHLGHELRLAQRQRHPRPERRRQAAAASATTPARARSRPITARWAATSSGRWPAAISAAAPTTATSIPERFAAQAATDQVKMIEIKLSQGAKPGHGGVLPAAKVTPEIAETRGVPMGQDCISPSRHSAFSTPLEMMAFITQLRELSRRQAGRVQAVHRPSVGVHGHRQGDAGDRGRRPTSSSSTAAEGGTGAAPTEFSDHIGAPDARGPAVRAQHPGRRGPARPDQDRRGRQDRQRLRHRQRAGHRRRLGQRGARLHVRGRLRAVASAATPTAAPPASPPRTRCARRALVVPGQGRAGLQLPPPDPEARCRTCWPPPAWSIPTS